MNSVRSVGLLTAIWSLVASLVLWLLPKDTYVQGTVAGVVVAISTFIVAVHLYLWQQSTKGSAKVREERSDK